MVMLCGYEDIAGFYVDTEYKGTNVDSLSAECLPINYCPISSQTDPWFKSRLCRQDFVLVAEFSELIGPVPLITIPKDGGTGFNLDEFVVKILSIDHQHSVGSGQFGVCEDSQELISLTHEGLYAYLHHLTLFDSRARGFVRPFCLAYVSPDETKLTSNYAELAEEFAKVSRYFKDGNLLMFFQDIMHLISDLQYTKERLQEKHRELESCSDESDIDTGVLSSNCNNKHIDTTDQVPPQLDAQEEAILNGVTLQELDKSITEARAILHTISEQLDEPLGRQSVGLVGGGSAIVGQTPLDRENFRLACHMHSIGGYHSNQHRIEYLSSEPSQAVTTGEAYKPMLRRCGKRTVQTSLRSLEELCHKGATDGLATLNRLYKFFSRDSSQLFIEKEDAAILDPSCSLLTIGRTIYVNFLTGFNGFQDGCLLNDSKTCSMLCTPLNSLHRQFPLSADTMHSFCSCDSNTTDSFESCDGDTSHTSLFKHYAIDNVHGAELKSSTIEDQKLNTRSPSINSISDVTPSIIEERNEASQTAKLDDVCKYTDELDTDITTTVQSAHHIFSSSCNEDDNTCRTLAAKQFDIETLDRGETAGESNATTCRRQQKRPEYLDVSSIGPVHSEIDESMRGFSRTAPLKEIPVVSIADHVHDLSDSTIGCGLLKFIKHYPFSIHVVFSLLSGRPVIIQGSHGQEKIIKDAVRLLWFFLPGHLSCSVMLCSTTVPSLIDLQTTKLYGLVLPVERKTTEFSMSSTVENHVTILNLEKQTLSSPPYGGDVLNDIISAANVFTSDGTYMSYVHTKLYELAMKAYVYFHGFSLRKSASLNDCIETVDKQQEWETASRSIFSKLQLKHDDALIVKYLVNVVKSQQITGISHRDQFVDDSPTISLDQRKCQLFTMSSEQTSNSRRPSIAIKT